MAAVALASLLLLPLWLVGALCLCLFALAVAALDWACAPAAYPLAGRTVVITGGSSGIGLACGVEAASRGARVAILARSADKFDAALRAINAAGGSGNGGATAHACDVTDAPAAAAALAAAAAAHGGRVDVLIASAGISQPRRFEETPTDEFEAVLRLNVTGVRNAVHVTDIPADGPLECKFLFWLLDDLVLPH
jgi:NADPH:quinone reductase-like Zn-dependent oxidoreductase